MFKSALLATVTLTASAMELHQDAAEDMPMDDAPMDDAPMDEAPMDEAPIDEMAEEEAPMEEAPMDEEAPAEENWEDDQWRRFGPNGPVGSGIRSGRFGPRRRVA